jgi:hypothetical protein
MSKTCLLDSDIAIKTVRLDIVDEVFVSLKPLGTAGMLAVAIYAMRKRLKQKLAQEERARIEAAFIKLSGEVNILEPSLQEIELAAMLEETARNKGFSLNVGESQLFAVLVLRQLDLLVTGDKRAVAAANALLDEATALKHAINRVACLEQLFMYLLSRFDFESLRTKICHGRDTDKAISICFSCIRDEADKETTKQALAIYIAHVRATAPMMLVKYDGIVG